MTFTGQPNAHHDAGSPSRTNGMPERAAQTRASLQGPAIGTQLTLPICFNFPSTSLCVAFVIPSCSHLHRFSWLPAHHGRAAFAKYGYSTQVHNNV